MSERRKRGWLWVMILLGWFSAAAWSGDILRGGVSAAATAKKAREAQSRAGSEAAAAAQVNGRDRLARTTQAIDSVRAMQQSARARAATRAVPDGLKPGGLQVRMGPNVRWTGAHAPEQTGNRVTIRQTESQAVLEWETFNVGRNTTLRFDQSRGRADESKWAAFNKVLDPSGRPSQILGRIEADGQVYVINQNGIVFGSGSQVNARTLVASTLPINDNLISRGLLNNPDAQFLFSANPIAAGGKGTPAFLPPPSLRPDGRVGDIVVESGATISAPAATDGNGGRVFLVGANVRQGGAISTPLGQTVLAAGLEVGIDAHRASDPSLRGLDVYVGSVGDYGGTVENSGLIEFDRGNVWMTGRQVVQSGVLESATSVSLNGRIDLIASYNALPNVAYEPSISTRATPFLLRSTGSVTFGPGSVQRILPASGDSSRIAGRELALRSVVRIQGRDIVFGNGAALLAPNGSVTVQGGGWGFTDGSVPSSFFISSGGSVRLGAGSWIDVSGSVGAVAALDQNILELELRGAELAGSPLQRQGAVRGVGITVDLRRSGIYAGREWIGTPLGDVSGFAALVERDVQQLTVGGGSVEISAGQSIQLEAGSLIDVSGGWVRNEGGRVETTRLRRGGTLVDIANATPDQIYDGIFRAESERFQPKWGVLQRYALPLAPTGGYSQGPYLQGADAGTVALVSPRVELAGELRANTVAGPRQIRYSPILSEMPRPGTLDIAFRAQESTGPLFLTTYPNPPVVTIGAPAREAGFALDTSGLASHGFGRFRLENPDGNVLVPERVDLPSGGRLTVIAANIDVQQGIFAPGGRLEFRVLNISPYLAAVRASEPVPSVPPASPGRGLFRLAAGGTLSTAGSIQDERTLDEASSLSPIQRDAGQILISAFSVELGRGSLLDVSGGYTVGPRGERSYGRAGELVIRAGQDPNLLSVLGGTLTLDAKLLGTAADGGGALTIQAPRVQIGSGVDGGSVLGLEPSFFQTGGFEKFTIIGLGGAGSADTFLPGIEILPGTRIEPRVLNFAAVPDRNGVAPRSPFLKPEGIRAPASVTFSAPGVRDSFTNGMVVRGDLVFGAGTQLITDAGGTATFSGDTVAILGSVSAPGGSITVRGGSNSAAIFVDQSQPLVTVYLGASSILSTAGKLVRTPDPFGRSIGTVWDGGTIRVSGNIAAAAGAVLDVSGASALLDIPPGVWNPDFARLPDARSGITRLPDALATIPVRVASNAGRMELQGGQLLISHATFRGQPGGAGAEGGALGVSTGRFVPVGTQADPSDVTLTVGESVVPPPLAGGVGSVPASEGGGWFGLERFRTGGFDELQLGGVVEFVGDVNLEARRALRIADGGFLYTTSNVQLAAPFVALGMPLAAPVRPEDRVPPFNQGATALNFPPVDGPGRLIVRAGLIDVGTLSLQGIGDATLEANHGDIRGSGFFAMAGRLTLRAGQIYPVTASEFTLVAYDGGSGPGSVRIEASGSRPLPLSAGGRISIHGTVIDHAGVVRAPLGEIRLGWDGTGTRPEDLLTGQTLPFPVTERLVLRAGSTTSVSAVDPTTGRGVLIPYGFSPDGETWIDPRGVDITAEGAPAKSVALSAQSLDFQGNALVDLRGGGDVYAYRWIDGNGGRTDILDFENRFAVIPDYDAAFAPHAPFNPSGSTANLIRGVAGYTNNALQPGERIYLAGGSVLPAGVYTLLPARYALLPGAVLVTPQPGTPTGLQVQPDGATVVAGYRFRSFGGRGPGQVAARYEVATAEVVRSRAEYADFIGDEFFVRRAADLNVGRPNLAADAGSLVFRTTGGMQLWGSVLSQAAPGGRGASVDIASELDFFIGGANPRDPGVVYLDAGVVSRFGAESLLIGGTRRETNSGNAVDVRTTNVIVSAGGTPLTGADIILAARGLVEVGTGAQIRADREGRANALSVTGPGSLLRVASDPRGAAVTRTVTEFPLGPALRIDAAASLSGGSLVLDTTGEAFLSPTARLRSQSTAISAGRIALQMNPGTPVPAGSGLVLGRQTVGSRDLSLKSYSTIDLLGSGTWSGFGRLSLDAGSIRGVQLGGGVVRIAADEIALGNAARVAGLTSTGPASGSLLFDARRVLLTPGDLAFGPFTMLTLDAASVVQGIGRGSLSAGTLMLRTPLLTGSAGSDRRISATGELRMEGVAGSAPVGSGLGGRLSLTGSSVSLGGTTALASGQIQVRALTGDLNVTGAVDVTGFGREFFGETRLTNGGDISLAADGGSVVVATGSRVDVSAGAAGGQAGALSISAPRGTFVANGRLLARAERTAGRGALSLDVRELGLTGEFAERLFAGGFERSVVLRAREGDVSVSGLWRAREFSLSADTGSIRVEGSIDASGVHGGAVSLAAHRDVVLVAGSFLDVSGEAFNHAGKGGLISLAAGSQRNGVVGDGRVVVDGRLDLRVDAFLPGPESQVGSSAFFGQSTGAVRLRAPLTPSMDDVRVATLGGEWLGASLVLVEGYRLYDLTSTGGAMTSAVQSQVFAQGTNLFFHEANVRSRLLASHPALAGQLVLVPGAEIINRTGDLTLGTATSTAAADWDLSGFRFGALAAPGVLTLRAAGDLTFFNTLSDGFTPTLASGDPTRLWQARLTPQNPLLPVHAQSWSYHLAAGADLSASSLAALRPSATGSLNLGKNGGSEGNNTVGGGNNALTSSVIGQRYQVIRTGSGDIRVHAAGSVRFLNHFSSIYTAGTRVLDATMGGRFDIPVLSQAGQIPVLGAVQQNYPALFASAGGDVRIEAGADIARQTRNGFGQLVDDSARQLPNNWLYRRGYVDPVTGEFGTGRFGDTTTTAWWVDHSNFFHAVGALGGGNVSLRAGGRIANIEAAVPTNARMRKDSATLEGVVELGGGDLSVRAGGDIDAGVYYVERGNGSLTAGGSILTNRTRSPSTTNLTSQDVTEDAQTWLPTTLFLGRGRFDVTASGDVLLGPVANPFLLPAGLGNSYWYKSYFSTYGEESAVRIVSVGGDLTLRQSAYIDGSVAPLLQIWARRQQLLRNSSSAFFQPWLRLAEETDAPFDVSTSLLPPKVEAVAFSGDVEIGGSLTLVPARRGSLDLLAAGSIHGLLPAGRVSATVQWSPARISVSDADPSALPGIARPFGYQTIAGTSQGAALGTQPDFLLFFNTLFAETGAIFGNEAVLQRKQSRHAPGPLHAGDPNPVRLLADGGDVTGLTLYSPKFTHVRAGRDITDVALYVQNTSEDDTSVVSGGRDLVLFNANSPLRSQATAPGNLVVAGGGPLAGDIQVSGPGALLVAAGRNLDLGTGDGNADGTGAGITSVGNARNPYLPFGGAEILAAAGLRLDDVPWSVLELSGAPNEQRRGALRQFFSILQNAGRDAAAGGPDGYATGYAAIDALFSQASEGDLLARSRDIRTRNGGDISVLVPGGGLFLASSSVSLSLTPPGIITETGGNVSVFARGDVDIGIGRIFTLRGGNILIWSSFGNIAAGAAAKTVQSAPPTRVLLDPQSAAVQTDLAGLATGGGIGVLATVADTEPGDVDLIAPAGTVDAGDAGIRVTGNLNIAATKVLNAGNISVGGSSAGVPSSAPATVSAPVAAAAPSSATAAASAASQDLAAQASSRPEPATEPPSLITVEVLGYGGTGEEEERDRG